MTAVSQEVTTSEMACFRDCHAKHGYRYIDGMRRASTSAPMAFGRMYHDGYAAAIRQPWDACMLPAAAAVDASFEAMREERATLDNEDDGTLEELRDAARWAVNHVVVVTARDWTRLIPLAIERSFSVPVADKRGSRLGHLRFLGAWDAVFYDIEQEDIVVHEHKSHDGSVDGLDRRIDLDPQTTGYVYAAEKAVRWLLGMGDKRMTHDRLRDALRRIDAGQKLTGRVCMNVVRSKAPSIPHVNEPKKRAPAGLVSARAIDTVPEFYEAALQAQEMRGLPRTPDQRERLQQLVDRGDSYFTRREFYRGEEEIEAWRRETMIEASRIRLSVRDPEQRTRNPNACCSRRAPACEYRGACLDGIPFDGADGWTHSTDPHLELERENAIVVE